MVPTHPASSSVRVASHPANSNGLDASHPTSSCVLVAPHPTNSSIRVASHSSNSGVHAQLTSGLVPSYPASIKVQVASQPANRCGQGRSHPASSSVLVPSLPANSSSQFQSYPANSLVLVQSQQTHSSSILFPSHPAISSAALVPSCQAKRNVLVSSRQADSPSHPVRSSKITVESHPASSSNALLPSHTDTSVQITLHPASSSVQVASHPGVAPGHHEKVKCLTCGKSFTTQSALDDHTRQANLTFAKVFFLDHARQVRRPAFVVIFLVQFSGSIGSLIIFVTFPIFQIGRIRTQM